MTLSFIYWLLMFLWLFFGIGSQQGWIKQEYGFWGHGLFFFALFGIIGWQLFGAPIHR